MRRAGVVASAIFILLMAAGCASADHSWRGEFDARLEGAARTVEEARAEVKPNTPLRDYARTFYPYGRYLFFKSELIAKLDPPAGCEALQVKGKAAVSLDASLLGGLFENLTPAVEEDLAAILEERVALLERREREANTCATS